MHLDSIFDGFQKLISGSDESREQRQLPFVIEKTIHNILFIKTHMQRQDEFDAVSKSTIILCFPFHFLLPSIKGTQRHHPLSLDTPQSELHCIATKESIILPFCSHVSLCHIYISYRRGKKEILKNAEKEFIPVQLILSF